MDKRFKTSRVLFYITLITSIMLFCSFVIFVIDTNFKYGIGWNVLFVVLFLLVPILVLLMMIKISFIDVIINEKEISKYRFKKLLLNISWGELKDIKLYNPICPWIVFAKESLDGVGIDKDRLFMKTIALLYVDEVGETVLKYCTNEDMKRKININQPNNVKE